MFDDLYFGKDEMYISLIYWNFYEHKTEVSECITTSSAKVCFSYINMYDLMTAVWCIGHRDTHVHVGIVCPFVGIKILRKACGCDEYYVTCTSLC